MADDLASASVSITPDLSGFSDELRAKLEADTADAGGKVTIPVDIDGAEAEAEQAKLDAELDAFGAKRVTATEDINTSMANDHLDQMYASLARTSDNVDGFSDKLYTAGISADDLASFTDKTGVSMDDLTSHLESAGRTSSDLRNYWDGLNFSADDLGSSLGALTPNVSVLEAHLKDLGDDTDYTTNEFHKLADAAGGSGGASDGMDKAASSAGDAGQGMSGLVAAAVAIGPALIPIAGVATGALIGIGDAAVAGGAGIAAFALAAKPYMTSVEGQVDSLVGSFQSLAGPEVMPVLAGSVGIVRDALQSAIPIVSSTSSALLNLEHSADSALTSSSWHGFTTFLAAEAGPAITTFGDGVLNLGHGFANLLEAFAPVETEMEGGLLRLTQGFVNWTSATGGVHSFVDWFQTEGPVVVSTLENLGKVAGDLLKTFGGYGAILLDVADPLLAVTNDLLKLNPVIGDIAIALIAGGLAWSKWGDGAKSAYNYLSNFSDSKVASTLTSLGSSVEGIAVRLSTLGMGFGSASAASDQLAASEEAGAGAADADAAAQARLGEASSVAAASQEDLAGASDVAAASSGGLAEKAALAVSGVTGVGAAGTEAAGGLSASGLAASGLGDALLTASAVALPLGAVTAAVALGWSEASQQANSATESTNKLSAGMEGQGANTIPALNSALTSNKALLNDLANEYNKVNDQYSANSTAVDANNKQLTALQSTFNDGYTPAVQKIQAENQQLNASLTNQKSNLTELNSALAATGSQTVLTSAQADQLGQALGINLNKALTGTQIQQFGAYLKQLSSQAGIAQSAMENLAQMSGQTMASLTKSISGAETATSSSFNSATSVVQAFSGQVGVTGEQIQWFYAAAVNGAQGFANNIQEAIKEGYNPQLIEQILQAGPAQAGQLLGALVQNGSQAYVAQINSAQSALTSIGQEAIQEARITQEAISSQSGAFAAEATGALAEQQAQFAVAAGEPVAQAVAALNAQYPGWLKDAQQYGNAIPQAFITASAPAGAAASGQVGAAAAGAASGKPGMDVAASAAAGSLPTHLSGQTNAALQAGADQVGAAAKGISGNLDPLNAAASTAAGVMPTSVEQKVQASLQAGADQVAGVARGISGSLNPLNSASDNAGSTLPNRANSHVGDATTAGSNQGAGLFGGINSWMGAISNVADTTGSQVHQKANAHTGDDSNAGSAQGGALFSGISTWLGGVTQISNTLGVQVHTQANAHVGDANAAGAALGGPFGLAGGITGATGAVTGAASALASSGRGALNFGDTTGIGEAAGAGIAAGLNAAAAAAVGAAAALVSNAVAGMKNALKIASPSQVVRDQVGVPFGQGLAVGIDSTLPLVEGSAKSLANSALGGLGNIAGPNVTATVGADLGRITSSAASEVSTAAPTVTSSPTIQITVQGNADKTTVAQIQKVVNESLDAEHSRLVQLIGAR